MSTTRRRQRSFGVRCAALLLVATAVTMWLTTAQTFSSFTVASTRSTASAASATLKISNSQGGAACAATAGDADVSCTSSLYPSSVPLGGSASQTNAVINAGTAAAGTLSASYQVPACGPVSIANTGSSGSAGVLLPRVGTTFAPTSGPFAGAGSVALDGSGYAASVATTSSPNSDGNYGYGIWFTGSASGVQPLFSLSSSSTTPSANTDRTLYLNAGKPTFALTAGASLTSSTAYTSGWHFAYVAIAQSSTFFGFFSSYTVSIYVDGNRVANTSSSSRIGTASGYWHLGIGRIGGTLSRYTGSLSGFVVDDSGNAPSAGPTPTSYTGFDTTATQRWNLADSGGSWTGGVASGIYTGSTYPAGGNPCSSITANWTATGPSATIASAATLSSLSSATTITALPGPGQTQTHTLQLSVPSSLNAYAQGLIIYAPVVAKYSVTASSSWTVTFAWNYPVAGSSTDSTFVIA